MRSDWLMIWPREMLLMNALRVLPRMANSSAEMKCVVSFVKGTLMRRWSMSWDRKLCRLFLSRPLYHADGIDPSGSPVPGTMKPLSCFDSSVVRGEAVYAITSMPIALPTLATCRPIEPYPSTPSLCPTLSRRDLKAL